MRWTLRLLVWLLACRLNRGTNAPVKGIILRRRLCIVICDEGHNAVVYPNEDHSPAKVDMCLDYKYKGDSMAAVAVQVVRIHR